MVMISSVITPGLILRHAKHLPHWWR